jgi:nicotinamide-nucleotide amidase
MFAPDLLARTADLIELARAYGLKITTAESCTGGLVAALLTEIPGSSAVVERGFVTYSNEAKTQMLGVLPGLIEAQGAVSAAVARAMAEGALVHSAADIALAITGVAGPGGGSAAKPVGLVHFALARDGGAVTAHEARYGDIGRSAIRRAAVAQALAMLIEATGRSPLTRGAAAAG